MKYKRFTVKNYRAIREVSIDLTSRIVPLVGVNECGKTTILKGIFCFDYSNDKENKGEHLLNLENLYSTTTKDDALVEAVVSATKQDVSKAISRVIAAKTSNQTALSQSDSESDAQTLQEFANKLPTIDEIIIARNLKTKLYYSDLLSGLSENDNNNVCRNYEALSRIDNPTALWQ